MMDRLPLCTYDETLRSEEVRLRTFEIWPNLNVKPRDLARAGFYYTKVMDLVRCWKCSTGIFRWEIGDSPMSEHKRFGGRCRLIRNKNCSNIKIGVDPTSIPLPSRDVCGTYNLEYQLETEPTETESLQPTTTCKLCLDKVIDTVILPCKHALSCERCVKGLLNCPICRTLVAYSLKIIIS